MLITIDFQENNLITGKAKEIQLNSDKFNKKLISDSLKEVTEFIPHIIYAQYQVETAVKMGNSYYNRFDTFTKVFSFKFDVLTLEKTIKKTRNFKR